MAHEVAAHATCRWQSPGKIATRYLAAFLLLSISGAAPTNLTSTSSNWATFGAALWGAYETAGFRITPNTPTYSFGAAIYNQRVDVYWGFNASFNLRFAAINGPADVVYLALFQSDNATTVPSWSCAAPAGAGGAGCFTASARVVVELVTYPTLQTAAAAASGGFAGQSGASAAFSPVQAVSGAGGFGSPTVVAAGDVWAVSVAYAPTTVSSGLMSWTLTRGAQSAAFSATLSLPGALNAAPSTGSSTAWLGFAGATGLSTQEVWVTDVLWLAGSPTPTPTTTPSQTSSQTSTTPAGNPIYIYNASYGANCNVNLTGAYTSIVASFCGPSASCTIAACVYGYSCPPSNPAIADPAVGCGKAFSVYWRCGVDAPGSARIAYAPGEAAGVAVTLSCQQSQSPTSSTTASQTFSSSQTPTQTPSPTVSPSRSQTMTITPSASSLFPVPPTLWFDAFTLAAAGLTTGTPVAIWPDSSGGGRNATQNMSSLRPIFYADGLGPGAPAVHFDGLSNILKGGPLSWTTPATLVAVVLQDCAPPTTTCCSGIFGLWQDSSNSGVISISTASTGGGTTAVWCDYAGGIASMPGSNRNGLQYIATATYNATSSSAYVNGCLSSANVAVNMAGSTGFFIGSRWAEYGRYFNGYVAELLYFATALTASQQAVVEQLLAAKWSQPYSACWPWSNLNATAQGANPCSLSMTPSVTASRTRSSSGSQTQTGTTTTSQSPTSSPTQTPSATTTISSTASGTEGGTPSQTLTSSQTQSFSQSLTPSCTGSGTPTQAVSGSSTQTPTQSLTPGGTASNTASQVSTSSSTQRSTESMTSSGTGGSTPSQAPTSSATQTPSASPTPSLTASGTASQVSTVTPTQAPSDSITPSLTGSSTPTQALTISSTVTSSGTQTPSLSGSRSASQTTSGSQASTPTGTSTQVVSVGSTPTPTQLTTPTASPSFSGTPSATATGTPTLAASRSQTRSESPSTLATSTRTPSCSGSGLPSQTGSFSQSVTPSTSSLLSQSQTGSTPPSQSATPSRVPSATRTPSQTVSLALPATASYSLSSTASQLSLILSPSPPAADNATVAAGGGQPLTELGLVVGSSAAGALLFLILLVCLLVFFLRRRRRSDRHADNAKGQKLGISRSGGAALSGQHSESRSAAAPAGSGYAGYGYGADEGAVDALQSSAARALSPAVAAAPYYSGSPLPSDRATREGGPARSGLARRVSAVLPLSSPEEALIGPAATRSPANRGSAWLDEQPGWVTDAAAGSSASGATLSDASGLNFSGGAQQQLEPAQWQQPHYSPQQQLQQGRAPAASAASATALLGPSLAAARMLRRASLQIAPQPHGHGQPQQPQPQLWGGGSGLPPQSPGPPQLQPVGGGRTGLATAGGAAAAAPRAALAPYHYGAPASAGPVLQGAGGGLGMARRRSSLSVVASLLTEQQQPQPAASPWAGTLAQPGLRPPGGPGREPRPSPLREAWAGEDADPLSVPSHAVDAVDSLRTQVQRRASGLQTVQQQQPGTPLPAAGGVPTHSSGGWGRMQAAAAAAAAFNHPRTSAGGGSSALVAAGSSFYQPPLLSPPAGAPRVRRASIA